MKPIRYITYTLASWPAHKVVRSSTNKYHGNLFYNQWTTVPLIYKIGLQHNIAAVVSKLDDIDQIIFLFD